MKRILSTLLIATVIAAGCGGGSAGGGGAIVDSPFKGTWTGTWASPSTGDGGPADIAVSPSGVITGTVHNSRVGRDADLTGTVSNAGAFAGKVKYVGIIAPEIALSGTISMNAIGQLIGEYQQSVNGDVFPGTLKLKRK